MSSQHYHVNTYAGSTDRLVDSTGDYRTKNAASVARQSMLDTDAEFWGDLIRAAVLDIDETPDAERVLHAHARTSLETAYTLIVEPCTLPRSRCLAALEYRQQAEARIRELGVQS